MGQGGGVPARTPRGQHGPPAGGPVRRARRPRPAPCPARAAGARARRLALGAAKIPPPLDTMAAAATPGPAACSTDASGTSGAPPPPPQPPPAAAAPAQPPEPRKPRVDPRRRRAALSFLTSISLDGRPPLQDEEGGGSEDRGARTRLSPLAAAGTALPEAGPGPCFPQPSPPPPPAPGGHAAPPGLAACAPPPDGPEELEEDDAFAGAQGPAAAFLGPATPGGGSGSRGRLGSFSPGILPIAFARQTSQTLCALEGPVCGAGALEQLQRSR